MSSTKLRIITTNAIARNIYVLRGHNVMLASDLAELYQVETFNLNKAVQRNRERFPADFMFQLTKPEYEILKFQIGISRSHGGRRTLPYAFTEQGVAMLSSVLSSKRAVLVNIEIMRTFAHLRQLLSTNKDLARRLDALEGKYDKQFKVVFDAIRQLMTEPETTKGQIGFRTGTEG